MCVCVSLCVWDILIGPSQVSKAVSRRFSCSPMKTICFTSKLWMRLEPATRVRLHSFPPKVTKLTLKTPFVLLFVCNITQIHIHVVFSGLLLFSGTKFHLLKASAHPALELSVDRTTLHYSHDAPENTLSTDRQWASVSSYYTPNPFHWMCVNQSLCIF